MEEEKQQNIEEEEEYLGNIWGWKVSFWGLFVIIFLMVLIYLNWDSSIPFEELPLTPMDQQTNN